MKIVLTPEEKQDLELRHEKECDGRVRDRIKSILLRDEGWTISKIAQALRLHNDTISRYVIDYIDGKKLHSARTDLCRGRQATDAPTATIIFRDRAFKQINQNPRLLSKATYNPYLMHLDKPD